MRNVTHIHNNWRVTPANELWFRHAHRGFDGIAEPIPLFNAMLDLLSNWHKGRISDEDEQRISGLLETNPVAACWELLMRHSRGEIEACGTAHEFHRHLGEFYVDFVTE